MCKRSAGLVQGGKDLSQIRGHKRKKKRLRTAQHYLHGLNHKKLEVKLSLRPSQSTFMGRSYTAMFHTTLQRLFLIKETNFKSNIQIKYADMIRFYCVLYILRTISYEHWVNVRAANKKIWHEPK